MKHQTGHHGMGQAASENGPIVGGSGKLALVIERLYRLRYLHRGDHGIRSSMDLYTYLWLSLGSRSPPDTG
jgi:hypothetical protein